MWGGESFMRGPGGLLGSKSAPCSPVKPFQKRAPAQPDSFHVIHKVPLGDSPYVKAKHVQLVDKDPDAAIALFWAAINAGDRVDSALKDMAIVMKQQNRPEEAIEAIKSLRFRCSDAAQESLDNVLLDLYKRCGRLDDQIALLKHKLHLIHQGLAFNGKRTKTARSQGKKFQVSIEQEATRLLGNLGWAYMQQNNYLAAEAVYRKALSIGPDNNKVCNLGICLMKQGRLEEAKAMLESVVPACPDTRWGSDSHLKSYERAQEMLLELESSTGDASAMEAQPRAKPHSWPAGADRQGGAENKNEPIFGALQATAGFGPVAAGPQRAASKKSQGNAVQQRSEPGTLYKGFSAYSSTMWDDYDAENVDTNIQAVGSSRFQQHFQQQLWPGEALHQRQTSDTRRSEHQAGRKVERSLSFNAASYTTTSSLIAGRATGGGGATDSFSQKTAAAVHENQHSARSLASGPSFKAVQEESRLTRDEWGKPLKSPLGNSELSFFSRWGYNETKNQRASSVRRSLSLESFDTQLELMALENEEAAEESSKISYHHQQIHLPQQGRGPELKRNDREIG